MTTYCIRTLNPLEALVNLRYLIRHDRADASKVLHRVDLADGELRRVAEALPRELHQP